MVSQFRHCAYSDSKVCATSKITPETGFDGLGPWDRRTAKAGCDPHLLPLSDEVSSSHLLDPVKTSGWCFLIKEEEC